MNAYGLTAKNLGEENERLKAENDKLHTSCTELTQCCTKLETLYKVECKRVDTVKADTVKKMQEFVHKEAWTIGEGWIVDLEVIDQIAKEMVEGK